MKNLNYKEAEYDNFCKEYQGKINIDCGDEELYSIYRHRLDEEDAFEEAMKWKTINDRTNEICSFVNELITTEKEFAEQNFIRAIHELLEFKTVADIEQILRDEIGDQNKKAECYE